MFKILTSLFIFFGLISTASAQTSYEIINGNDSDTEFKNRIVDLGYVLWSKKDIDSSDYEGDVFTLNFMEQSQQSGTWISGDTEIYAVVVKASNKFLFVDFGTNSQTNGNWCTNATCFMGGAEVEGLLTGNGNGNNVNYADLSHISLYTMISPVPEASTVAMMLSGLGFVGFMAKRRQQQ